MKHSDYKVGTEYLETPRQKSTTVKLDTVLEARMKMFLLSRRRRHWLMFGE